MGNPFAINPNNMFAYQQPVNPIGGIGVRGPEQTGSVQGGRQVGGAQGGASAVDRELADMRRFIPSYNGTGELRPNNAEEGATLKMLYA